MAVSGLPRLIGDLDVADQAVDLDLDLGTVAGPNLGLPVAQQAEPAFAHAASRRNAEHQTTSDTHKGVAGVAVSRCAGRATVSCCRDC